MEIKKEFEKIHKEFAKIHKKFDRFATKDDLKAFATKSDLNAQTQELKEFALEQTESLARIIATTVAEPLEKHLKDISLDGDLSMRVLHLEKDVRQIKKTIVGK